MPRGSQITRQWRILRLLEGSATGMRVRELYDILDRTVSQRTLFRDLEHLQEAGFPLYKDDEERWRCRTVEEGGYSIPIQTTELLAILLCEELLAPMRSADVVSALGSLRSKIKALLNKTARDYAEELKQHLIATFVGPGDYGDSEVVRTIEDAIHRQHQVQVHYWSPKGQVTERRVDPYLLWYADGRLYLVGWCHLRDGVRTFLVDRVRHIELVDAEFTPDPGFDANAFTGSGMGAWSGERHRVELFFQAPIAHLTTERCFHPTQQVTIGADGSAQVTMHVAGLPHIAAWVASFGGQIIARAPVQLIDMIADIHRSGLAAHREG